MRVSVFGLGYVGTVSCGCMATDGVDVIGVDVNEDKVASLNRGLSPIVEEKIGDLISTAVQSGRLRATCDTEEAVVESDISLISVGTPSETNGSLSLKAIAKVSGEIGNAIRLKSSRHLVVLRSTVLPGTTRDVVVPAIEGTAERRLGDSLGVCFNPEFLREGSSVSDYYNPPYTLIGSWNRTDAEQAGSLYERVMGRTHQVSVETAEMTKYISNAFHGLKITFANEVGSLAQAVGVDSHTVMDLVCKDTKLNISDHYLRPGFAFGGSCLPKDLRALLYQAKAKDVELPLIQAVIDSNRRLIDRTITAVLSLERRRVSLLGLSFKAGTDDLRESPLVALAEAIIGRGLDLRVFDSELSTARLVGANKRYIEEGIPHLSSLLSSDLAGVVTHAEVLIIGNDDSVFRELPKYLRPGQVVIDLVRLPEVEALDFIEYRGIAW